jgi:hypothetical protein
MLFQRIPTLTLAACFGLAGGLLPQPAADATQLVQRLRDDEEPWNAIRAMRELKRLPDPPIPELQAALESDDRQQRQIAAHLLWRFLHPPTWLSLDEDTPEWRLTPHGEVTRRLLEVTIDGLNPDRLPFDNRVNRYTNVFNAADGFRHLVLHAREARELLEDALQSDAYRQRFLCALALGFGGVAESAPLAAPILLPHLRDNDIAEDAKWCTAALYRFGPPVLPLLREARSAADAQQAKLLDLLILDLEQPPESREDLEARRELNQISRAVFDPATEGPLDDWMGWIRSLPASTVRP